MQYYNESVIYVKAKLLDLEKSLIRNEDSDEVYHKFCELEDEVKNLIYIVNGQYGKECEVYE